MKKTTTFLFLGLLMLSGISIAQSDLYIGYRGNGTATGNQLTKLDTADLETGGMTLISNTLITSDFGGDVDGIYGMALQPFTGDVYCVYGTDSGDPYLRRLGIIDLPSAEITDIAEVGAILDITMVDTTLYGSTGAIDTESFVEINKYTGETTVIFDHMNGGGGSAAINFDYFNGRIIRSTQSYTDYSIIDINTFNETTLPAGGHPGWTTTLLSLNDEQALSIGNTSIQLLNTSTFAFSPIYTFPASNWLHSSVFGSYPQSLWVNGNRNMCAGDESVLTVLGGGSDFEWYRNGVLISGADASTYTVTEEGLYSVVVDGEELNKVNITYSDPIDGTFVIATNPAYLGGDPDVTVGFIANDMSPGLTYDWDSGNGEVSDVSNPLFTYDAIGTYDATLIVSDESGCEASSTQTLEVVGGVSLAELDRRIELYPNPVNNDLFIQLDGVEDYVVEIIDINGAVVLRANNADSDITKMDVSNLTSGTYICRITANNHITEKSFVKQ